MIELLKILPVLALGTAICIFSSAWILTRLGIFSAQEVEEDVQPEFLAALSALDVKVLFTEEQAKGDAVIIQPAKTEIIEYRFSIDVNAYEQFPASAFQSIELTQPGEHNEIITQHHGKKTRYLKASWLTPEKTYFDNLKDSRIPLAA